MDSYDPDPADVSAAGVSVDALQTQRDILEAGVRLGLAALAQGSPEMARAHLEEALQRALDAAASP